VTISNRPFFTDRSRLLLLAPHPDDESLACSVLLQQALEAGAAIRVVYVTDGDNNPWPQRALERKWRLQESDRARWGMIRRTEALAALAVLGVNTSEVEFLGLPDQRLTNLLLTGSQSTLDKLERSILQWNPSDIIAPDLTDTHPDHSATALLLRIVLEQSASSERQLSLWNFLVHGNGDCQRLGAAALLQTRRQRARKIAAIDCHKTQLSLSRRRFMAYADRPEHFVFQHSGERNEGGNVSGETNEFIINVPAAGRRLLPRHPMIFVFGYDHSGSPIRGCIPLKNRTSGFEMFEFATGCYLGRLEGEGSLASGMTFGFPSALFSPTRPFYLKLHRPGIFFDQAGWMQVEPARASTESETVQLAGELSLALG